MAWEIIWEIIFVWEIIWEIILGNNFVLGNNPSCLGNNFVCVYL